MKTVKHICQKGVQRGLAALLLVVVGFIQTSAGYAELVDRVVALVNDDIILQSDLELALIPIRQNLRRQGYTEAQQRIFLADQRSAMLEQLIDEKLTDQQAERLNLNVEDDEITATIKRIQAANKISDTELRNMLEMDGLDFEKYREKIKEQLLRQKLVNWEVRSKIVITDSDVRAYYEKNADHYQGKTQYHLKHILLKVEESATDSERRRVYELMQQIYDRLKAGEDFSQLAVVYSQASSAEKGGDLGIFESRLLARPIREAVEGLEQGQFTGILDTDFGYQIFYIEEVTHTGGKSIEEVKGEIEEKLYADIVNQKFQSWLKDLRQHAHVEVLE